MREAPEWLETEWTLRQFGASRRQAVERYRAFVADGKKSGYEPWEMIRGQIYLGSDQFLAGLCGKPAGRPRAKGVPRRQQHPLETDPEKAARRLAAALGTTLPEVNSKTRTFIRERRLLAWALRRHGLLTLERIGEVLSVGLGQASALALAGEAEAARSPAKARLLESALS